MAADGLPDDRVTCRTCGHFSHPGRCRAFSTSTAPSIPLRCSRYVPLCIDPDQRTGEQRWPGLAAAIDWVRADEARARATP